MAHDAKKEAWRKAFFQDHPKLAADPDIANYVFDTLFTVHNGEGGEAWINAFARKLRNEDKNGALKVTKPAPPKLPSEILGAVGIDNSIAWPAPIVAETAPNEPAEEAKAASEFMPLPAGVLGTIAL